MLVTRSAVAVPTSQPATPAATPPAATKRAADRAPAPAGAYEQMKIGATARTAPPASAPATNATMAAVDSSSSFDTTRVMLALGVVLGLILVLRWFARHLVASSA